MEESIFCNQRDEVSESRETLDDHSPEPRSTRELVVASPPRLRARAREQTVARRSVQMLDAELTAYARGSLEYLERANRESSRFKWNECIDWARENEKLTYFRQHVFVRRRILQLATSSDIDHLYSKRTKETCIRLQESYVRFCKGKRDLRDSDQDESEEEDEDEEESYRPRATSRKRKIENNSSSSAAAAAAAASKVVSSQSSYSSARECTCAEDKFSLLLELYREQSREQRRREKRNHELMLTMMYNLTRSRPVALDCLSDDSLE